MQWDLSSHSHGMFTKSLAALLHESQIIHVILMIWYHLNRYLEMCLPAHRLANKPKQSGQGDKSLCFHTSISSSATLASGQRALLPIVSSMNDLELLPPLKKYTHTTSSDVTPGSRHWHPRMRSLIFIARIGWWSLSTQIQTVSIVCGVLPLYAIARLRDESCILKNPVPNDC